MILTNEKHIRAFHMRAQISAIKLEGMGMRHSSGRSVLAHCKRTYGLTGSRDVVIAQMKNMVETLDKL